MTARHTLLPPALPNGDADLVRLAAWAEAEWHRTCDRDALALARVLRAEVAGRGLGPAVVRALASSTPPGAPTPRPGPVARVVDTPHGRLPSLLPHDLAEPEPPEEVDDADVISLESA